MTAVMTHSVADDPYALLDEPEEIVLDSSIIRSIRYDERVQTLEITFETGSIYHYLAVPEKVKDELITSPSKGSYFGTRIRNQFPCRRIR